MASHRGRRGRATTASSSSTQETPSNSAASSAARKPTGNLERSPDSTELRPARFDRCPISVRIRLIAASAKPSGSGMVSTPRRAAAGPAHAARWLGSRTPVLFENGGADTLLMTGNTRSGGVSQGRAFSRVPARASLARVGWLSAPRQRAERLDGRRSGGYSATNVQGLCFQHVHAQEPPRLRAGTENTPIRLQLPHSTSVHAQQPVNTSVFAATGCRPLIPLRFPQRNF